MCIMHSSISRTKYELYLIVVRQRWGNFLTTLHVVLVPSTSQMLAKLLLSIYLASVIKISCLLTRLNLWLIGT